MATKQFTRRKQRNRTQIKKKAYGRARLSVCRSGQHISVQIIDDAKGVTLASASTMEAEVRKGLKSTASVEAAKAVGELIAKRAKEAKVEAVVFDRGGYLFHGRVKALAEAARAAGMAF